MLELLDIRQNSGANNTNTTSYECRFNAPQFIDFLSETVVPTFAIEPTNTATLEVTGSFTLTDVLNMVCDFPTTSAFTPVVTQVGGTASYQCEPLTLAYSYTGITCPGLTLNELPTGTYELIFETAANGPTTLVPNTFVIATPSTVTESPTVYVTATTTLDPLPTATDTVTSVESIQTVSTVPPAVPSTTVIETVYSTIIVSIATSTPAPLSTDTVTEYTSTETSTVSLSADPASTVTEWVSSCPSVTATPTQTLVSATGSCVDWSSYCTDDDATFTLMCSKRLVGDIISTSHEDTYQLCATECGKLDNCIAFSWVSGTSCTPAQCSLFSYVDESVSGKPKDVTGTRVDNLKLPNRKIESAERLRVRELLARYYAELDARTVVEHCTTCHPDYTYPPYQVVTSTVSITLTTDTVTPTASGILTVTDPIVETSTEVEPTPTSGIATETITTDSTTYSTTVLDPTVAVVTSNLVSTTVTTITPSPLSAVTVTLTHCPSIIVTSASVY